MKLIICLGLFVLIASAAAAASVSSSSPSVSSDTKDVETELKSVHSSGLNNEYSRFRKSAGYGGSGGGYGGASIPAPPCPKNYLFSCQPNLAPVPCAAPAAAPSYGSAGAYSAPVPTYMAPLVNNYGTPQGYSGFLPQSFNQFYHY